MTWRKIVREPAPEHRCRTPLGDEIKRAGAYIGSEWECSECGKLYVLVENVPRKWYEGVARWERVA